MIGEHRIKEVLAEHGITEEEVKRDSPPDSSYLTGLKKKYHNWRKSGTANNVSGASNSRDSDPNGIYANRISKDEFGQEISGISKKADITDN
jgi:hypothetical protein